jgi:hypothetical protein
MIAKEDKSRWITYGENRVLTSNPCANYINQNIDKILLHQLLAFGKKWFHAQDVM